MHDMAFRKCYAQVKRRSTFLDLAFLAFQVKNDQLVILVIITKYCIRRGED